MNKFLKEISCNTNATLQKRATTYEQTAKIAYQTIINNLIEEKSSLELKIADLTDLAPDTKDSLRPGSKDWDPKKWAKELQETKEKLYMLNISLKIAQDTFNEYFLENVNTTI